MNWMNTTSCLIRISLYSLTFPTSLAGSCLNVRYLWLTLRISFLSSRHSSSTVFRSLVTARLSSTLTRKWQSVSAAHHSRSAFESDHLTVLVEDLLQFSVALYIPHCYVHLTVEYLQHSCKLWVPCSVQGAPIKNNPLGKINYLSYCNRFFHQIHSFYRQGFRPHRQQILSQYLL